MSTRRDDVRAKRANQITVQFVFTDVHEIVLKSFFRRVAASVQFPRPPGRGVPAVPTYRLDQVLSEPFDGVSPATIGSILKSLYDWGFVDPVDRRNGKTKATLTNKGWAMIFFYLNRGDFGDRKYAEWAAPFISWAAEGPEYFAGFVGITPSEVNQWLRLARMVWIDEEGHRPDSKQRPWPFPVPGEDRDAALSDAIINAGPVAEVVEGRTTDRHEGDAPSAGNAVEGDHPIDAIIETRSPRMTDEEVERLYLKRSEDSEQVMLARLALVRNYGHDIRFDETPKRQIEDAITKHLTPVEIIRFDHEQMWKGPQAGLDTLVERMSKAGDFKPHTLADYAPNRLGITDMQQQGFGVSRIAKALRMEDDAAAGRALGLPGDTSLGDLDYILHSGDGTAPPDDLDIPEMPPQPVPTEGSTGHWFSGGALHVVRSGMTLYGRPLTIDFILSSDYDEFDTDMVIDVIDNDLIPKMTATPGGWTHGAGHDVRRETHRIGDISHTVEHVVTRRPIWQLVCAALIGSGLTLAVLGVLVETGIAVVVQ